MTKNPENQMVNDATSPDEDAGPSQEDEILSADKTAAVAEAETHEPVPAAGESDDALSSAISTFADEDSDTPASESGVLSADKTEKLKNCRPVDDGLSVAAASAPEGDMPAEATEGSPYDVDAPLAAETLKNEIILIAPEKIRDGGIRDRFALEFDDLADSIRSEGQRVPVIVRRDRDGDGFLLVAGRRRLAACASNGIPVRAEIQDLDEDAAVRTQLIENASRENLTFIERTKVALMLNNEHGYRPADLASALNTDQGMISRFLKVARMVPDGIASWIGAAPKVGRERWEKLAGALGNAEQLSVVESVVKSINREEFKTDEERFRFISDTALTEPKNSRKPRLAKIRLPGQKRSIATAIATPEGFEIRPAGKDLTFNKWLSENSEAVLNMLVESFQDSTAKAKKDGDKAAGEK